MTYVDGFVAAVPTANREKFKRHAEEAADIFKENGALKVVECWGDDVSEGQVTSFPTTPSPPNWKSAVTETPTGSSAAANQDGCEPPQPSFRLVRQSRPRFIFAVHCRSVHAILDPAKQDPS
jgi:hypothetical protein